MKKYNIGYTTGVYDMFHVGHLNILKKAKARCNYLVVGVTTDELCRKQKNKTPIINEKDRVAIIKSIKYVDRVILQKDMNKLKAAKRIKANVIFVGSDWKGTESWKKYEKELEKIGCDVVYLKHTDGISSTILREKIKG